MHYKRTFFLNPAMFVTRKGLLSLQQTTDTHLFFVCWGAPPKQDEVNVNSKCCVVKFRFIMRLGREVIAFANPVRAKGPLSILDF